MPRRECKQFIICFLCLLSILSLSSQTSFKVNSNNGSDRIKFKLVNNLIIIPVEVNGVALSFILDSGVNKTILFNVVNKAYNLNNAERLTLNGLGDGEPIEAVRSFNNSIKVGDAVKLKHELFAIFDSALNLAPRLGFPVHGIIGYDLFKDLIVEIKYSSKSIKLTNPEDFKYKRCRKCKRLPIEFYNNKPYLKAEVNLNKKKLPVKLLIDSGGSDALWLFEDESIGLTNTGPFFTDFLGQGLSGAVYGKRARIDGFNVADFKFEDVTVSYPDSLTIKKAKQFTSRNGSIGGELLKRFNITFNYKNSEIRIRRNSNFKKPFLYNLSGIELQHSGMRLVSRKSFSNTNNTTPQSQNSNGVVIAVNPTYNYVLKPSYSIAELRENSPAYNVGLRVNDEVLKVNGRATENMKLHTIMQFFFDEPGKRISMKVNRLGSILDFNFRLEDILK